jgi:site-specific DNA-methyltransferase (adenine-specific)
MKPISEVTNEDCMDMMARYPDKFFDLAIVDPPYGIGMDGQKECICKNPKYSRKGHEQKGWDLKRPPHEYFVELERVSKNQIIWGANYFVENLTKGTKGWICWYKGQQGLTMSDCELAYSSFNYPTRVVIINRVELIKQHTIHPTEKPIKLYAWILKKYAKQGDKILDTHLGSGSSRIAAYKLGFDFYATEIDKDYFDAQEKRFRHECFGEIETPQGTFVQTNLF